MSGIIFKDYLTVLEGNRKKVPAGTWDRGEDSKKGFAECYRYIALERYGYTREDIIKTAGIVFFKKVRLAFPFRNHFNSCPYTAAVYTFPEFDLKPWEFKIKPRGIWDSEENIINAVKWMVTDKLGCKSREDILSKVERKHFINFSLSTLITGTDKRRAAQELLIKAFPEYKFKLDDFDIRIMLNKEEAQSALKSFIEDTLQWSYEEILRKLDVSIFEAHGLRTLLKTHFNESPRKLMECFYPDKDWSYLNHPARRTPTTLEKQKKAQQARLAKMSEGKE